jgi:hypothetical protein
MWRDLALIFLATPFQEPLFALASGRVEAAGQAAHALAEAVTLFGRHLFKKLM